MDKEIIEIMIKEPGEEPIAASIENDANAFRTLIGGSLEHIGLDILKGENLDPNGKIGILLDADGIAKGLAPNFRCYGNDILGTVIFIGEDGSRTVSLTDRQKRLLERIFKAQQ